MSVSVQPAQRAACDRGDRTNLHQLRAGHDLRVAAPLRKKAHAMILLAPGAISITDGAVVIAAETVAPRLGLKPEARQAEVQRRQVGCLPETGVDAAQCHLQITVALERLMEEDAEAGPPFIAALVISKARGGLPAMAFFDCARRLGRFTGDPNGAEARSFHAAELNAAQKFWGGRAANCRDQ